ncbi:MAG: hypothetical protein IPI20_10595 [Rhodoferax sp.]|nr:hypothetical protein [Rhodoferax sp.]
MPKNSSFHLPKRSYASSRAHDQKRCSINRNRLTVGTRTVSSTTTQINYGLDAAGNLTSDGLRLFEYDASNRLAKVLVSQNAEASKITYLHNALGQRVFKSEPTVAYTAPDEAVLGTDFITWLKKNFGWLFAQAQVNATLGQGYVMRGEPGGNANLLGKRQWGHQERDGLSTSGCRRRAKHSYRDLQGWAVLCCSCGSHQYPEADHR